MIELLVAMSVFVSMLIFVVSVTNGIFGMWKSASDHGRGFVAAQAAFEAMKRQATQATLNTYWAYFDALGNSPAENADFTPAYYGRASELFFITGPASSVLGPDYGPGSALFFQIPAGYTENEGLNKLSMALNTIGYFVKFESDDATVPPFIQALPNHTKKFRYRLYEVKEPTENLKVHADMASDTFLDWAQNAADTSSASPPARPIAENIILLLVRCIYQDAAGNEIFTYTYNSRTGGVPQPVTQHQLPSRLELTLVALDESSAARLAAQYGDTAPPLVAGDRFTDPDECEQDITELASDLSEANLTFRIFREEIPMPAAHWSVSPPSL